MKTHIIFEFKDGPYGGGNQFLKALRNQFLGAGAYAENPAEADIFLFNSFQDIRRVLDFKRRYSAKPFVHRVDGPISLYRGSHDNAVDRIIFGLNHGIADATIFQSQFSYEENVRMGMNIDTPHEIIPNAADAGIFHPVSERTFDFSNRKTKLISTSWSANMMKGFEAYSYLDSMLDFSKYEYVFVGRSPIRFKNITMIPPQTSEKVAEYMRGSDIYITASRKDPCSNSLIEALSCGIPAVALNDGGHPELVREGGELFNAKEEIIEKIERIKNDYARYVRQIPSYDIGEIAGKYLSLIKETHSQANENARPIKNYSGIDHLLFSIKLFFGKI